MRHLLALLLALSSVPAAAQQVGTLVSADPLAETPPGVQAWRVRYWTSSQDSQRQEVTGMVVAPREAMPAQPRHVIAWRSEEHTSELQSLMPISYAVFCLKKK